MLAVVYVTLVHAMTVAMQLRGPWYDEFYTLLRRAPWAFPCLTPFTAGWRTNHPPLFYALARANDMAGHDGRGAARRQPVPFRSSPVSSWRGG